MSLLLFLSVYPTTCSLSVPQQTKPPITIREPSKVAARVIEYNGARSLRLTTRAYAVLLNLQAMLMTLLVARR